MEINLAGIDASLKEGESMIFGSSEWYLGFVEKTFDYMTTVIRQKNADYTGDGQFDANFTEATQFGIDPLGGLCNRMNDKMMRVKSYCKTGKLEVEGEGLKDCFQDLIGYSTMALGMLEKAEREATRPARFTGTVTEAIHQVNGE